jgi:hypothetical protein
MNALMRARRAGFSGTGFGDGPTWNTGTGHSDRDFWGNIFTQANQTLQTFILTRSGVNPLALQQQQFGTQQGGWVYNQQTGQYYNPQTGQTIAGNYQSSGVGFGIDGQGIRMSDGSHIGWLPIAGVVVAFSLLQSRGFSRR